MKTFVLNLKNSLADDFENIKAKHNENNLIIAKEAVSLYGNGMLKLKKFLESYNFIDSDEEIHFFKNLKPSIHKYLIYYSKFCKIESRRPIGSTAVVKQYLIDELNHLKRFFDENADLYQYIRLNRCDLDHIFFLRKEHENAIDDLIYEKDPNFSTLYDFKVAKIEANKNLIDHLSYEIMLLENPDIPINTNSKTNLKWTASKAWLIELAYSLYCSGVINNGNASIREIIRNFETMYSIDLKNCYGIFSDIRGRKKNPTIFLDKLKENVQQKIDEPFELPFPK